MNSNDESGASKRMKYGDKEYEEMQLKRAEEVDCGGSDIYSDDDLFQTTTIASHK